MINEAEYITPDTDFIDYLIKSGGESLKKCFQCGSCSVVCSLSPQAEPFPRKEMVWAQWGLKERLLSDPDVWLCHGCNDCSTYCPRGARPGDVLAAIRSYSITHLAAPRFLAQVFSRPLYLPLLLAIPVVFLIAFLASMGQLRIPEGEIVFSRFIPAATAEITGVAVAVIVLAVTALRLRAFWKNIGRFKSNTTPKKSLAGSLVSTLMTILKHSNFRRCETNRGRYWAHMAVFYGCMLLLVATGGRAIYTWIGREGQPLITDPVKIAGNLGGLLLILGLTVVIYRTLSGKYSTGVATYFDWFLVAPLYLAAISGFATEAARLAQAPAWAYSLYVVHLVFVFAVLVYLPFSKLAHLLYRTLAMVYAEQSGRKAEEP